MKRLISILAAFALAMSAGAAMIMTSYGCNTADGNATNAAGNDIERGVSRRLAEERAKAISDVSYEMEFCLQADADSSVTGRETIRFRFKGDRRKDLLIDFAGKGLMPYRTDDSKKQEGNGGMTCRVNGRLCFADWKNEHIAIPGKALRKGMNSIEIGFIAADKSLNRNGDYMYTLFVPANARTVFPCFDQPDLKAVFKPSFHLPEGWQIIHSTSERRIPTYLFSFVAGRFQKQTAIRDGRRITALYRETDPKKVAQLSDVFSLVGNSIRWLERYTGMPYPFKEYGFVVLPGYQFGGMEHPEAIQFTDHEIFLGEHPTPEELQTRLELVAHETAHCWFGDCVTMRWFDDVWTKEVFANFLASKIAREEYPEVNHDLNFLRMYQTRALSVDRTLGTHPIQQRLDNLSEAGLLYGNIIYSKAPVMMRKLEEQMGKERFRQGLAEYLSRFAFGNATWDDLICILDRHAPEAKLKLFSNAWVKQKGMPTISAEWNDGELHIKQHDPYARGLCWQQGFLISAYSDLSEHLSPTLPEGKGDGDVERVMVKTIPVDMQGEEAVARMEERPWLVLLNSTGEGYGRFVMDGQFIEALKHDDFLRPSDELKRFAMAMNLYENFQGNILSADDLALIMRRWLAAEKNAMIGSVIADYWATAANRMEGERRNVEEQRMWTAYRQCQMPSVKQRLIRLTAQMATSGCVADSIYNNVWMGMTDSLLSKSDYTKMAYRLAILKPYEWRSIIDKQRSRLSTADELRQFDFISRACTPDTLELDRLFNSLLKAENRRQEPWTQALLQLLNDPSREPHANKYLRPGLDALIDVQRTGDIFFPGYWLSALLSGHHSPEAKRIVEDFINSNPDYPEKLMNKLKENASPLLQK